MFVSKEKLKKNIDKTLKILGYLLAVQCMFSNIKETNCTLQAIEFPRMLNSTELAQEKKDHEATYEFVPWVTIVGFGFIGFTIFIMIFAKIMLASSDEFMSSNRYDLVIFKAPTKSTKDKDNGAPKRIYGNTAASAHNLAASLACGFDVNILNPINPYAAYSSISSLSLTTNNKL